MCLAAIKGNWEDAKRFIDNDRELLRAKLTKSDDTVIHIAVTVKSTHFLKEMAAYVTSEELAIENKIKTQALVLLLHLEWWKLQS